jgi:hypothetical protein
VVEIREGEVRGEERYGSAQSDGSEEIMIARGLQTRIPTAQAVAEIKKKPPAPSLRTRAEARHDSRDVLRLLASCRDGCTDALMTAHGFGPVELSTALADDQPSR